MALILALAGCGKSVGAPCAIEGSGFTASHDCRTKCLQRWTVHCPNGESIHPAVCAGRRGCEIGQCPDSQACYYFDDPFDVVSYCVPADLCGPLGPGAIRDWEKSAEKSAAEMRAHYEKRKRHRTPGLVAPQAEPVSETPVDRAE